MRCCARHRILQALMGWWEVDPSAGWWRRGMAGEIQVRGSAGGHTRALDYSEVSALDYTPDGGESQLSVVSQLGPLTRPRPAHHHRNCLQPRVPKDAHEDDSGRQ